MNPGLRRASLARNAAAWRSTSTLLGRAYSVKMLRRQIQVLHTLLPEKLKSSDFVDLTGKQKVKIYFGHKQPPIQLTYRWSAADAAFTPFPLHARGYLYYCSPPPAAPLAGSIRLRVNSDSALGSDLLLPNGLPWKITLPQLVASVHGAAPLRKLLSEGLVSSSTVDHCTRVFGQRRIFLPDTMLFHLDQPFALAMDQAELLLTIVGRERLARFTKQRLFGDPAPRYPFKGNVVARFELSPDATSCFIRIVRVVSPVICIKPDYVGRIVEPKTGEYLTYRPRVNGDPVPWSLSLAPGTSLSADALRLLLGS
ncbi:hypothetical protein FB451DRAFT_202457 [Mycena latifolia]|nr:hypothetical protein FB451DRAFT_202457 [Mycena latifolia]